MVVPKINSAHGSETRNIINAAIDSINVQGKSIQDLVAEGQLTPAEYATLIQTVNGLVSKGNISVYDINKNAGKLDSTFFTDDFISELNNGELNVTNVLPGSIGTKELSRKSVTFKEATFTKENKINLFSLSESIDNMVVNTTGELSTNNAYITMVAAVKEKTYYSLSQVYYLGFYNAQDVQIGATIVSPNVPKTLVESPVGASIMKFSVRKSDFSNLNDFLAIEGNNLEDYSVTINHLALEDKSISLDKTDFLNESNEFSPLNVYNPSELSDLGWSVSTANGVPASTQWTTEYRHTDYIPVSPNVTVIRKYPTHYVYYDENKNFISANVTPSATNLNGVAGYGGKTPPNTGYIIFNVKDSEKDEYIYIAEDDPKYKRYTFPRLVVSKEQIIGDGDNVSLVSTLTGKKGVAFGDSITQQSIYTSYISNRTGCDFQQVGFGATRLARIERPGYFWKDLSMCDIADAITTRNFTTLDAAVNSIDERNGNNAYAVILSRLKAIDFNEVDFITIMYGTNDVNNPIFSIGEKDSTNTFDVNGALNHILTTLWTKYPHLKIYLMTPILRSIVEGWTGNSDDSKHAESVYLWEIAQAIIDKAKEYHTPVKDLYNESGINGLTADLYLADGTHPNEKGKVLMAESILNYLNSY